VSVNGSKEVNPTILQKNFFPLRNNVYFVGLVNSLEVTKILFDYIFGMSS